MILPLDPRVVVDEGAREDLVVAVRWYRSQRREIGAEFLQAVAAAVEMIAAAPERWQPIGDGYRRYVLRRFPYVVIYEIEQGRVIITAIAHGRRSPGYWRER